MNEIATDSIVEMIMNKPAPLEMRYSRKREISTLGAYDYRGIHIRILSFGWYPAVEIALPKRHPLYGKAMSEIPDVRAAKGLLKWVGETPHGWSIRWEHSWETDFRIWDVNADMDTPGIGASKKRWTTLEMLFELVAIVDELAERYGEEWMEDEKQKGVKEVVDGC